MTLTPTGGCARRGGEATWESKAGRGGWQLHIDHPAFRPMSSEHDAEIVGEVKWMARTFGCGGER